MTKNVRNHIFFARKCQDLALYMRQFMGHNDYNFTKYLIDKCIISNTQVYYRF